MPGETENTETQTLENGEVQKDETLNNDNPSNENEENKSNEQKEEDKDTKQEENKEEENESFTSAKDSSSGVYDTLELTKEIAKLETTLENIGSNKPDISTFHKNINEYLTEDEQQLLFEDDKSSYFEAVEAAKEKFLKDSTPATQEQEDELKALGQKLVVSKAIDNIVAKPDYKDFNFTKLQKFWNEDLTGAQRRELDKNSKEDNIEEHLISVYKAYRKANPIKIKTSQNPNIPDASKVSKTSISDKKEVDDKQKDEQVRNKIGFRKL